MPLASGTLTDAEKKNGWSRETIADYQQELVAITSEQIGYSIVPGNVVTQFQRPRPAVRYENAFGRSPFKWQCGAP